MRYDSRDFMQSETAYHFGKKCKKEAELGAGARHASLPLLKIIIFLMSIKPSNNCDHNGNKRNRRNKKSNQQQKDHDNIRTHLKPPTRFLSLPNFLLPKKPVRFLAASTIPGKRLAIIPTIEDVSPRPKSLSCL